MFEKEIERVSFRYLNLYDRKSEREREREREREEMQIRSDLLSRHF